MFEKKLADQLKRIFDLKKVSYDVPSETKEQECIFVNIQSSKNHVRDGKFSGQAKGKIIVFGDADKLPYGYFSKRISEAKAEDTAGFFFHDFEENMGPNENIAERIVNFVYLFDFDYDPLQKISVLETDINLVGT